MKQWAIYRLKQVIVAWYSQRKWPHLCPAFDHYSRRIRSWLTHLANAWPAPNQGRNSKLALPDAIFSNGILLIITVNFHFSLLVIDVELSNMLGHFSEYPKWIWRMWLDSYNSLLYPYFLHTTHFGMPMHQGNSLFTFIINCLPSLFCVF